MDPAPSTSASSSPARPAALAWVGSCLLLAGLVGGLWFQHAQQGIQGELLVLGLLLAPLLGAPLFVRGAPNLLLVAQALGCASLLGLRASEVLPWAPLLAVGGLLSLFRAPASTLLGERQALVARAETWLFGLRGGPALSALRIGLLLALCLASAQRSDLLGVRSELAIPTSAIRPAKSAAGTLGWEWRDPALARGDHSGAPTGSRVVLFEGAEQLGPAHSLIERVSEAGAGRYVHWEGSLFFSTTDGSDPRTNGRSYRVRSPYQIRPLVFYALFIATLLIAAPWIRLALRRLEDHPGWVLLALALATLVWRVSLPDVTSSVTGGLTIKGMPFSDAQGWFDLSEDFSRGTKEHIASQVWDARRPLTYQIYGAYMALFGARLWVVIALNIALSCLSTLLIYDLLRRLAPSPIALAAALVHLCSMDDHSACRSPMSETLGYFLTNVSLWLLVRATLAEARGRHAWGTLLVGGLVFAASNLARPLTLLAVAAIPLVFWLVRYRREGARRAFRSAIPPTLVFGLGVALCLFPWLVRQRVLYGISTISDNTAEMLYSASSKKYLTWSAEASSEPSALGFNTFQERNAYFTGRFKENVKADPLWYLGHVLDYGFARGYLDQLRPPAGWLLLGLGLLACWGGTRRGPPRGHFTLTLALLVAIGACSAFAQVRLDWVLTALGLGLALRRGVPLTCLIGVFLLTLLSIGVVAAPYRRLTYSLEWISLALTLWSLWELGLFARRGGLGSPEQAEPAEPPAARESFRGLSALLLGLTAIWVVGLGVALAAKLRTTPPPGVVPTPMAEAPGEWVASALQSGAAPFLDQRAELSVERGFLRPDFQASFAAGERFEHWSPIFSVRPFAHTLALMVPLQNQGNQTYLLLAGGPPRPSRESAELTVVGRMLTISDPSGIQWRVFHVVAWTEQVSLVDAEWRYSEAPLVAAHARWIEELTRK